MMGKTNYNLEYYYDAETNSIKIVDQSIITINKSVSFDGIWSNGYHDDITIDWDNGNIQFCGGNNSSTTNIDMINIVNPIDGCARYTLLIQEFTGFGLTRKLRFGIYGDFTEGYSLLQWPYGHPNVFMSGVPMGPFDVMIINFIVTNSIMIGIPSPNLLSDIICHIPDTISLIAGI